MDQIAPFHPEVKEYVPKTAGKMSAHADMTLHYNHCFFHRNL